MIASGDSVLDIAIQLKEKGARRVYCAVSFALFTEGPDKFDKYYKEGLLDAVYSTNLTYVPEHIRSKEWFREVDLSKLLSSLIHNVNLDISLSSMLDKTRGIKRIVRNKPI